MLQFKEEETRHLMYSFVFQLAFPRICNRTFKNKFQENAVTHYQHGNCISESK